MNTIIRTWFEMFTYLTGLFILIVMILTIVHTSEVKKALDDDNIDDINETLNTTVLVSQSVLLGLMVVNAGLFVFAVRRRSGLQLVSV